MSRPPDYIHSLIQALRYRGARPEGLSRLSDSDWSALLEFCDNMRLTLPLGQAAQEHLPGWVQDRILRNIANNKLRFERIQKDYARIAEAFRQEQIEHLVLKGFAQWPQSSEVRKRVQYDIDLFCPSDSVFRARDVLSKLGYEAIRGFDGSPSDHLPIMIRPSNWRWRGDFFDPDLPIPVDLHFQFWNVYSDRIPVHGLSQFWDRRTELALGHISFPALALHDSVAYTALHAFRHLLHGSLSTQNIYDLAGFLHSSVDDRAFWCEWKSSHPESLRRIQAICFRLASEWFDCTVSEEAQEEIDALPAGVERWFGIFETSPLYTSWRPNKDALWLHLSLLESAHDRRNVFARSLFPTRLPTREAVKAQSPSPADDSQGLGTSGNWRYVKHLWSRTRHHGRLLPQTLFNGVRWWWSGKQLKAGFWTFVSASFFYTLGMYIFFFLYNLYLLDLGYKEDFLGLTTGALAVGGIVGTLPAGFLAQRFGLRKTLLTCFTLVPLFSALRALATARSAQLGLSFLVGMVAAIWAVCISPALAHLTTEKTRPFGFSLVFSIGIGIGVLGGLAGGHLPGWAQFMNPALTSDSAKRVALLVSCAIMLLAAWPAWYLKFPLSSDRQKQTYSFNPFLRRYLPAIALWSIATGAFTPFVNAYFAGHLRMPIERVGLIFSGAQLLQVVAILLAPIVFRKFGLVTGIMYTQLATAVVLAGLAANTWPAMAGLIYAGYVAFQWMSEPGIYSLLMNQVTPSERSGAAALNTLVISAFQAASAAGAGMMVARFGYPSVLMTAAIMACVAGLLFRVLLRNVLDQQEFEPSTAALAAEG